jgi:hypothetical protein
VSTNIRVVAQPDLAAMRRVQVLVEDRIGHYAEFRDFFARTFELDHVGLSVPGYVAGPSGGIYEFVFVGRSGEPFPAGAEINALVEALEPLDEQTVDRDLWAILRWMIAGVGAPWTVADLDATGRLYRLPAVGGS